MFVSTALYCQDASAKNAVAQQTTVATGNTALADGNKKNQIVSINTTTTVGQTSGVLKNSKRKDVLTTEITDPK